jgi:hypothetical protein
VKVFISWSGDKSRDVALALRDWLPGVINSVEPFVSAKDIYAGSRWQMDIATELDTTNFGIVCVTKDNQLSPWLNFEAGALAKAVDSSRVVPLAIDLKSSDVELPLGQFQAQPATKQGISDILTSINSACDPSLAEDLLKRAFVVWWPDLERQLEEIDQRSVPSGAPTRSERELLEETLNTVRSLARNISRVETLPPNHPLVGELETLLQESGFPSKVMTSRSRRRIGIRAEDKLPLELQADIEERAQLFGVGIDFLAPPRARPSQAPPEGDDSATPQVSDTEQGTTPAAG